ncbi:MAG: PIG-L deacetylase family protein [Pirellulales bacterium]
MPDQPLRLLILGAHPDDAEFHAGGLAARYGRRGHTVKMISVTNGDAGHQSLGGARLAAIRQAEAAASAAVIGATAEVWDHHDGQLQPTLELRWQVIRELRSYKPDLVLTHRTNDYHPDHRAVGHVVRDASYLVTVPAIVPEVPILRKDPIVAYMADHFTKPTPLQADVILDVSEEIDAILSMLTAHRSQFFEWLPFNRGELDQVPADETERRAWLAAWFLSQRAWVHQRYAQELSVLHAQTPPRDIRLAEAYEISEYASQLSSERKQILFCLNTEN